MNNRIHQPSRRYISTIERYKTPKEIYGTHNKRVSRAIKKAFRDLIKLIFDSSDQGVGKTTRWIRHSINNNWLSFVFISTHYKAKEIKKDLELSPDTFQKKIKPKLKYHLMDDTLRIHTLYSKSWKLDENDWYVSPQFEGIDSLCPLSRENPRLFKMLEQGHLNKYCRKYKSKNDKSKGCIHVFNCFYNKQFNKIIEQIKGNKWQLLEKIIREQNKKPIDISPSEFQIKYPKLIKSFEKETGKHAIWKEKITKGITSWINKKLKDKAIKKLEIEKAERKKIHHIIILPHIYIFLDTLTKLLDIFKDETGAIIDESPLNLLFEPITIHYKRVLYELKFLKKYSKELKNEGVSLEIYKQFIHIIRFLFNNLKYNRVELKRIENIKDDIYSLRNNRHAQELTRQDLEKCRNELDDLRSGIVLNRLIEFSRDFDEKKYQEDYTNYINGIIELNKRKEKERLNLINIPDNLFVVISNILAEIKRIDNKDILENRIDVDLRNKFIEISIDRRASLYKLIEDVKNLIIFTDATAERSTSMDILGYTNPSIFISRENISKYQTFGYPENRKLNAKYQLWDPEKKDFFEDGIKLIDRTAWLIKEHNSKKLMIALYGEFNNWNRGEEKYNGLFMRKLGRKLKISYNIDIKDLDIVLGFWYSEGGKDMYKDREVQIQFGCPGIPGRATKNRMRRYNLSKQQVNRKSIFKEQEQMAGRCRSFLHYRPVKLFLLTSKISSYFDKTNNIDIILKYTKLIKHIREHNKVTTRQIQRDLYPDRATESIRETLLKIKRSRYGLVRTHTISHIDLWHFRN